MENYLFDEFEPVSKKVWKQKIQVDLKGLDYNETLLWRTTEGITVKPFYTKEDRTRQKIQLPKEDFSICQSVFIDNETIAGKLAADALKRGADTIEFIANDVFDIEKLITSINLPETKIYFKFNFLNPDFVKTISKYIDSGNCYFNIDIIGNLAKTGNWFSTLKSDYNQLEAIIDLKNCISVNASIYQNGGANCVQQLAYALAHANEYLNHFGNKIANKIHFNFSTGSNYFFEIAKLRAFRILWKTLLNQYEITPHTKAHIFVQPSLRNKTLYDYNVNMLRTSSECMSAVLGGANTISNISYDELFHKSNEFGNRISRNQLLIIKEESGFQNAQHFADGSYYIEKLTEQLAEKALGIFKLTEQGGGFLKQLKKGIIQQKIEESADKEQKLFDKGELVLLGTNKIQNENDIMKNDIELFPFVKKRIKKTLIKPVTQKRLAEESEQKRLENE